MKNLIFLMLISCTLFFACTKQTEEAAPVSQEPEQVGMAIDLNYLQTYQQFEKFIVSETADDMNSFFTVYVAHIDFLGRQQELTTDDFEAFITQYQSLSFEELYTDLSSNEFINTKMLEALKNSYDQMKNLAVPSERISFITEHLNQTETDIELDLFVQILQRYSRILMDKYEGQATVSALDRDCVSDCRWTNIYYGAYYASYDPYLASCGGYCYSEASAYAHNCGQFACMNFCN